jgi:hypothetical protein
MKKHFILLLLLNITCLFSQTSNNPFDVIKENDQSFPESNQENTNLPEKNKENINPFDVAANRVTLEKKPVYINPNNEVKTSDSSKSNTFIFWVSLLSLLITTIALTRDRKAFNNFPKLITNRNYLKLVNRDLNSTRIVVYVLLYFSFFLSLAAFLYLCAYQFYGHQGLHIYLYILMGVVGTYAIRHLILFILKTIITTKQSISDHGFLIMVSNGLIGMALIPLNLLFNYSDGLKMPALYLSLAIIVIFYIWRQVTGIFLSNADKHVSIFHFFIYICSLEIAPALIIIKLIHGYL